jgi:hypothetical protein
LRGSLAAKPLEKLKVMEPGEFLSPAEPLLNGLLPDSLGWNQVFIFLAIGSFTSFVRLLTIAEPIRHPAHTWHCPRRAFIDRQNPVVGPVPDPAE